MTQLCEHVASIISVSCAPFLALRLVDRLGRLAFYKDGWSEFSFRGPHEGMDSHRQGRSRGSEGKRGALKEGGSGEKGSKDDGIGEG
jgi:hypothetical protein